MRRKLYRLIEFSEHDNGESKWYDFFMIGIIILSIVPLCTHKDYKSMIVLDNVTMTIFVIDYILRFITADYKLKKGFKSFILYPFSLMAVIDLISILPSITLLQKGYRLFRIVRLLKTLRILRVLKAFRYSNNIKMILNVFRKQKNSLIVVCSFTIAYVILTALIMFQVEPQTFTTMFDAIYWATISLTTVGYGDVYATTDIGKLLTMISSILGIAIVALPAGIIVAGYQEELKINAESRSN